MKTLLQLIAVSLLLGSCSSLNQTAKNDLGTYDEAYSTPADDALADAGKQAPVENKSYETLPSSKDKYKESDDVNSDYRKYKETDSDDIVKGDNESPRNDNYNYSDEDDSYYDNEDDFSYGRSFQRLRYGDGYSDGYNNALYNNYSSNNFNYYSQFGDPYWGWNRPLRTRFWVGYNTWNGWSVGYNYGYPSWGWRTSYYPCYTGFYDPWYGYNTFSYGYYSNMYYGGSPYGYYDPYFNPYFGSYGYNYGWGGFGNNYYNNPGNSVGNRSNKGGMYGPRETIGSNSPTTKRKDQVSPKSRGGMVTQDTKDPGTTYDPSKDKGQGMVSKGRTYTDPGATAEVKDKETGRNVGNNSAPTGNGTSKETRETYSTYNGSTTPESNDRPKRETRETRNRSYDPSFTPGTTYETPKEETKSNRSYEPSRNESRGNNNTSGNTYQRREEPRSTPSPRSYDAGSNSRGSYSSPSPGRGNSGGSSPGGGNSGGSSSPSSKSRGR